MKPLRRRAVPVPEFEARMNRYHKAALEQVESILGGKGGTSRTYFTMLVRSLGFQFKNRTIGDLWNIYEDRVLRVAPAQMAVSRPRMGLAAATPNISPIGHRCVYCGDPAEEIEHVWPRSRGGDDHPNNLVRSCRRCNSRKGTRSILGDSCPSCGSERHPSDVVTATGDAFYSCRCGHSWSKRWNLQEPRLSGAKN